jgi:acetyltransferase
VVLHEANTKPEALPKLAIRPYPHQYVKTTSLKDGGSVTIRPIRPEDEPLLVKFHQTLSENTVRLRYFHPMKLGARIAHERLIRVCFSDYDREMVFVAEKRDSAGQRELLGVGRLNKIPYQNEGEFAVLVSDGWQNRGLGTALLAQVVQAARDEKLSRVSANILPENLEMQHVAQKLGFSLERDLEEGVVQAEIRL